MKRYITFLRGINVGGQKKIKMADLCDLLEKKGLKNVKTYIQSGNVFFETTENSEEKLSVHITNCITNEFGFEVPVIIKTHEQLLKIREAYPFTKAEDKNKYFTLLQTGADAALVNEFNALKFATEDYQITKECVYLNCKQGAGKAKLNNNLIEKKLQIIATTRNLKTIEKMLALTS